MKKVIAAVVAVLIGLGGLYLYKDHEYRRTYGVVTEVGLFNYDQEVEQALDGGSTVLLYFYKQDDGAPVDQQQLDVVKSFAWRSAGKVKVVEINVSRIENLPLAIAYGAVRQPAFVFASGKKQVKGAIGKFTSLEELNRLNALLQQTPAPAPAPAPERN